jgi:hypothetical protein
MQSNEFKVIRQDLKSQVEKFGVQQHPNPEKLLNKLKEEPPKDEDEAKKVFEYLESQQIKFTYSDWDILANLKFIPIRDDANEIIHIEPRNCFFKTSEDMYMYVL